MNVEQHFCKDIKGPRKVSKNHLGIFQPMKTEAVTPLNLGEVLSMQYSPPKESPENVQNAGKFKAFIEII